ncbi:MAG: hypothetical protein RQ826_11735 [Xanthomonadales bacterium]|nr:hypothetical protein [Xanthomonadales bacterium]
MTVSVFVTYPGPAGQAAGLEAAFREQALPGLSAAPGLRFIETFRPAPGEVPAFAEDAAPALLAELNFDTPEEARDLLDTQELRAALSQGGGEQATVDVFHSVNFPLPGHARPPPRKAPLSFVVRYHRPVADEAAFVAFYTQNHPLLLARLPGIRNVLCYLPTGLELPAGMSTSSAFFGNEVVFGDLDSLNRALASEVLEQLKAEGRQFPPFGHNTHHAMLRRAVFVRPN